MCLRNWIDKMVLGHNLTIKHQYAIKCLYSEEQIYVYIKEYGVTPPSRAQYSGLYIKPLDTYNAL